MHCVPNTWHDIHFCDPDRGMHGATRAEFLYCLQVSLFLYSLDGVFAQKKKHKSKPKKQKASTSCHKEIWRS
jgi:hypothetical protein